ncbi:MAG: hypothetical protein M3Q44_03840 [bacterium]|nr:hypothetical protein [bacterium]
MARIILISLISGLSLAECGLFVIRNTTFAQTSDYTSILWNVHGSVAIVLCAAFIAVSIIAYGSIPETHSVQVTMVNPADQLPTIDSLKDN